MAAAGSRTAPTPTCSGYEATLATGEIIRGATSKPYSVTVSGSDDRVTLTVPSLRLSAWGRAGGTREQLRVCAARTKDGNAATYYRITSLDPSTAGDPNGYVANTQSADTVEIVDEYSDTTLVTKEPHYTTGDVPSNDPIAPGNAIAEGKGRLFVTSASDPNAIYYSQERAEGLRDGRARQHLPLAQVQRRHPTRARPGAEPPTRRLRRALRLG